MIPLEALASELLQFALERSVAFTIVFTVMGIAWWMVKGRLNSHVGSLWFLVPLVLLVIPIERWVPNPWTASNPIERVALSLLPPQGERTFIDPSTEGFIEIRRQPTPIVSANPAPFEVAPAVPIPLSLLFLATWALCMLAFLIRLGLGQGRMQGLLRSAQLLDAQSLPIKMERVVRSSGTSRPVMIFESPEFDSPALWTGQIPAIFRPSSSQRKPVAIILPEGLTGRLSKSELRWVLLHELAHLARGDHHTELLQRILGAAFLFHPLVWLANRISRSYREMACDDAALARCAESDRKRCARALFEVVSHATSLTKLPKRSAYRTPHAMSSLFHSKKLTRKRIMRLIELDRPLARGLRLTTLLPLLLVSGVALAAARFPGVSRANNESNPAGIQTEYEVEGLPDMDTEDVAPSTSQAATRKAVRMATDWLIHQQGKDGGWSYSKPTREEIDKWSAGFKGPDFEGPDPGSFMRYHNDVALTALALQSLVKRAEFEGTTPELTQAIERAVGYLLAQQDPKTGRFGASDFNTMVGQALATEAIALAMRDRMTPKVLESLKASVQLLESARNPYQGWRYDRIPAGDNDARITGYVLLALVRASAVGAHVEPRTLEEGLMYLHFQEDADTGRTNYMHDKPYAFRLLSHKNSHPAERAEAPTAMHLRLRNASTIKNLPAGATAQSIELLASKPPLWSLALGTIDYTYWWQAAEALVQTKEATAKWPHWCASLRAALIEHQLTSGPQAGTWPTVDAWSTPGLEVYTTATCALALYASLEDR